MDEKLAMKSFGDKSFGDKNFGEYAVTPRQSRKFVEPGMSSRTFEILDMSDGTRKTIDVGADGTKTAKRKRKNNTKTKAIVDMLEANGGAWDEAEQEMPPPAAMDIERPQKIIKVHTDITETSIKVLDVHVSDEYVCIFLSTSAETKLKPKTGVEMEIEVDGEIIPVVSPGMFFTARSLDVDVVFLLVSNKNME